MRSPFSIYKGKKLKESKRGIMMEFLKFMMAVMPIVVVLVGIMVFKKSAKVVAPLGMLCAIILAMTFFNVNGLSFAENVATIDSLLWKGIKEGFKIVAMIFGAFTILNTLKQTGAIDDVKTTVAKFSGVDRRVQLIVVGMMVPIFLEGAAGAGAPAAIASPFLVALGFDPIVAVAIALLGDATPCSWGGAGLTTISGGAYLVEEGISTVALNSAMVGRIHMFGVLIIPFIMVAMAFGKKGFKGIIPYLTFAGLSTCVTMFVFSNYIGPEVTSMGTGVVAMLLTVLYVKFVPIKTPEEYRFEVGEHHYTYHPFKAVSSYAYMLVLIPAVRYGVPAFVENGFGILCTFGYISWVDGVIIICAILGALTLNVTLNDLKEIMVKTMKSVAPVMITIGSLLVMAYIMQSSTTGMMSTIANDIASLAGTFYPAAAVFIGALGSFVTGTGLGSNVMFASLHTEAATTLAMNPITVFAGQNAGASLGNLICPNNTVAACATVDKIGSESEVMKKTLVEFAIVLVVYMVLSMLYTLVLFSGFGM